MTTEKTFPTERWAQWVADLEEVKHHLINLSTKRAVWLRYRTFLQIGPLDYPDAFHLWAIENYADSMAVGIRRVVDKDTRAHSLYTALSSMAVNASEITVDNYMRLWDPRGELDGKFAEDSLAERILHGEFSRNAIEREAHEVRARVETILTHVNKRVAHSDRNRNEHPFPTWENLNDALDVIIPVFKRYYLVLTCADCDLKDPMPFGWERVFDRMGRQ